MLNNPQIIAATKKEKCTTYSHTLMATDCYIPSGISYFDWYETKLRGSLYSSLTEHQMLFIYTQKFYVCAVLKTWQNFV